jgi:hypothetical protein
LIQSLRGIKPVENDILNAEKTVNKEKMASYAEILKDDGKENENTNTNTNTKSNSLFVAIAYFFKISLNFFREYSRSRP